MKRLFEGLKFLSWGFLIAFLIIGIFLAQEWAGDRWPLTTAIALGILSITGIAYMIGWYMEL